MPLHCSASAASLLVGAGRSRTEELINMPAPVAEKTQLAALAAVSQALTVLACEGPVIHA